MIDEEKITEINSKRKPTKGFSEGDLHAAGMNAVTAIVKNHSISRFNVKAIYKGFYLTSSVSESDLNYITSGETK